MLVPVRLSQACVATLEAAVGSSRGADQVDAPVLALSRRIGEEAKAILSAIIAREQDLRLKEDQQTKRENSLREKLACDRLAKEQAEEASRAQEQERLRKEQEAKAAEEAEAAARRARMQLAAQAPPTQRAELYKNETAPSYDDVVAFVPPPVAAGVGVGVGAGAGAGAGAGVPAGGMGMGIPSGTRSGASTPAHPPYAPSSSSSSSSSSYPPPSPPAPSPPATPSLTEKQQHALSDFAAVCQVDLSKVWDRAKSIAVLEGCNWNVGVAVSKVLDQGQLDKALLSINPQVAAKYGVGSAPASSSSSSSSSAAPPSLPQRTGAGMPPSRPPSYFEVNTGGSAVNRPAGPASSPQSVDPSSRYHSYATYAGSSSSPSSLPASSHNAQQQSMTNSPPPADVSITFSLPDDTKRTQTFSLNSTVWDIYSWLIQAVRIDSGTCLIMPLCRMTLLFVCIPLSPALLLLRPSTSPPSSSHSLFPSVVFSRKRSTCVSYLRTRKCSTTKCTSASGT